MFYNLQLLFCKYRLKSNWWVDQKNQQLLKRVVKAKFQDVFGTNVLFLLFHEGLGLFFWMFFDTTTRFELLTIVNSHREKTGRLNPYTTSHGERFLKKKDLYHPNQVSNSFRVENMPTTHIPISAIL